MRPTLIAIACAALVAVPSAAHARQWWMVNFHDGVCETPQQVRALLGEGGSPDALVSAYRNEGIVPDIDVIRYDNGDVKMVFIKITKDDTFFVFTTSAEACQEAIVAGVKSGAIVSRSDLR